MSIKLKLGAVAFSLCALFASSVMADPVITQVQIDESTQGAWTDVYGSCYNLVPQASPRTRFPEIEVGPDFQRGNPEQYMNPPEGIIESAVCIGGDAEENFDVRIFSNTLATPGDPDSLPNHAFAWGFNEHNCVVDTPPGNACSFKVREFTAQDNACLGFPYPSTFDDEDVAFEPLSSEIKLVKGGDARIAYYFLSEDWQCRSQDYRLTINGLDVAGNNVGTVDDISVGKYVVFDITGIPDGATIRLDVTIGDPNCAGAPTTNGPNSHMSGIFVDGTDACLDPFCGDGNVDPGETCEMPGDATNDGGICRDDCTYCGDGITDPVEECDPANPDDPNAKMCTDSCEIIPEELGCRFTGGLNDVFENNRYSAGGQVGANTGQQPQPKGEWTHRQRKGPAGKFTFHGGTASAPEGSEIDVIRCSDPGGCKPSGDPPSPVKQLDFDGIGNFKNIGKKGRDVPDFVKDGTNNVKVAGGNRNYKGTLHWFEVNIDDLGEPGNTNPNKNPGDGTAACPATGFGEKGEKELAECSCSDFYRITIYDGVDATTVPRNSDGSIDKANMNTKDVIYEVWGYIDGGNLQLHHPTGFDLK